MRQSSGPDAPNVRIVPPLVYLAGLALGFLANTWMPFKFVPAPLAWSAGALLMACGASLAGSAVLTFKRSHTTVRPDRAATALVIRGPYKISRNPMYLGLAAAYLGISIAGQSIWALILLPLVLLIIQRRAIEPEERFLRRRFGTEYVNYAEKVHRWI